MCTGSRLALLLKHADGTLQHKQLSTTEGQGVALMNLEALTEIWGDLINSGHIWPEKRKLSTWVGTSKKETDMPDTARTSIIRHSVMPMIPSESSICHSSLGRPYKYIGPHVSYLGVATD